MPHERDTNSPAQDRPGHGAKVTAAAGVLWRLVKTPIVGALNILLALVLLFEEWGWKPLAAALSWLARFRLIARAEALVSRLPPYPSLVVFALPSAILFPVKLGAIALLAGGHVIKAGLLLAAAKVTSTALVARLFVLTRPQLMQIGWFARAYDWFVPWKEALFARVRASFAWRYGRMLKSQVRRVLRRLRDRWRPRIVELLADVRLRAHILWQRYFGTSV